MIVMKLNYNDSVYWNNNSYGKAISIKTKIFKRVNLLLSFIIVGLYHVPLALIINKLVKNKIIMRY